MSLARSEGGLVVRSRATSVEAVAAAFAACCVILAIFRSEVGAALATWNSSSAYSYCVLILPISLYLIYSRRAQLRQIEPVSSFSGVAVLLISLAAWWLGMAASITELRQFAVVGMLQAVVLCLLGRRFYRAILFPMLYLFLMVPTASALLGPLQTLTTVMSSGLLRLTGIPVLSENHLIQVPHGLYQVAPGCAGLNFLLASLALSLIYVLVLYRSPAKRAFGVVVALLLSMATNVVRVFGIIWLAEATDRRIDIIDDHVLYGWGVYCIIMLAAMYVGFWFRDPPEAEAPHHQTPFRSSPWKPWLAALALMIFAGGVQASFAAIDPSPVGDSDVHLDTPAGSGGWYAIDANIGFPPVTPLHADGLARLSYGKAGSKVDVLIAYYWRQRDGHKITDIAEDIAADGEWAVEAPARRLVPVGTMATTLEEIHVAQGENRRLIWTYDWVGGHRTADALSARLMGARSALGGDGRSAIVILSADDHDGHGRDNLADFLGDASMLDQMLADASLNAH